MNKVTVIIPARKGSKGIKNKNRIIINGLPLVEYSIIIAKLCKYSGNIILSSDDNIILDIGRKHNIDLIERPPHLATDTASALDVIKHVIKTNNVLDDIMLLEPTSPVRTLEDLYSGIEQYYFEKIDSLHSLSELKDICFAYIKKIDKDGKVIDAIVKEIEGKQRQYYINEKFYERDGLFYLFKKNLVLIENTIYGRINKGFITNHETVDINGPDDLFKAERLLKQKEYQFFQRHKLMENIIYIDIDETICHTTANKDYSQAIPIYSNIEKANKLFDEGNIVIYWTARGTVTGIDWRDITEDQLNKWKVKYHELKFGKPNYHLFIDDRVLNTKDW